MVRSVDRQYKVELTSHNLLRSKRIHDSDSTTTTHRPVPLGCVDSHRNESPTHLGSPQSLARISIMRFAIIPYSGLSGYFISLADQTATLLSETSEPCHETITVRELGPEDHLVLHASSTSTACAEHEYRLR